ncbi:MAG: hypothetical protein QM803_15485 [Rhodocyclaceae bacterium]
MTTSRSFNAIGDDDDGHRVFDLRTHPFDDVDTRDIGQLPVDDEQVDALATHLMHQRATTLEEQAFVPERFGDATDQVQVRGIIVERGDAHATSGRGQFLGAVTDGGV